MARSLEAALPEAEVCCRGSAEELLRDTRILPPDVGVLQAGLTSALPLSELLTILRARPELAHTHWVALGGAAEMTACAQAGADCVLPANVPSEMLTAVVRTLAARAASARALIGEVQQARARLADTERDERSRDQLVHMLVHDLKNPLGAVLGLLELVEETGAQQIPKNLLNMISLAREEAQHVLYLAANMLDVRKMQAGKMRLDLQALGHADLEDILARAATDVGTALRERRFETDLRPLPPFQADPEVLRRVFANLISNAVKHTRVQGRVWVTARQEGPLVRFEVRDNGEGIPAEDLPRLFSAFEQARVTLQTRFDTGMGLAFCKLAVEQHGGRIFVQSRRGEGSCFYFTLPVLEAEPDDGVLLVE
nr:HAMP domain-containing sensor histidine kinase [Deinobacterium chartae]